MQFFSDGSFWQCAAVVARRSFWKIHVRMCICAFYKYNTKTHVCINISAHQQFFFFVTLCYCFAYSTCRQTAQKRPRAQSVCHAIVRKIILFSIKFKIFLYKYKFFEWNNRCYNRVVCVRRRARNNSVHAFISVWLCKNLYCLLCCELIKMCTSECCIKCINCCVSELFWTCGAHTRSEILTAMNNMPNDKERGEKKYADKHRVNWGVYVYREHQQNNAIRCLTIKKTIPRIRRRRR